MQCVQNFPTTITSFERTIPFENEKEKQQIIESVAKSISDIYTAFLTEEWHYLRENCKDLLFVHSTHMKFPPADEKENFRTNLQNKIIEILNQGDEDYDLVYLSTDNAPEMLLGKILKETKFTSFNVNHLFPIKTSTQIKTWNSRKEVTVLMTPSKTV